MKNWRTTLLGIASIIFAIASFLQKHELTNESIGLLTSGAGLIFAKDSKKEQH